MMTVCEDNRCTNTKCWQYTHQSLTIVPIRAIKHIIFLYKHAQYTNDGSWFYVALVSTKDNSNCSTTIWNIIISPMMKIRVFDAKNA